MGRAQAIGGALAGLLAFASGCQFDSSQRGDVGEGDDPGPDGGPCPEALVARVTVNGVDQPLTEDGPYVHVLLGDTVELSAAASCSQRGELSVSWRIEPQATQIEATADPGLGSESITVYPVRPESYIARLTVDDGTESASVAVFAFQAHGFRPLDHLPDMGPAGDVQDLFAGAAHLWIATNSGAFRADLADPDVGPYPGIQDLTGGAFDAAIAAVYEDERGVTWLGRRDADDDVYLIDGSTLDTVGFEEDETPKVRDIGPGPGGGVLVATDRGTHSWTGDDFDQERDEDTFAVALAGGAGYAGGDDLYPVPEGDALDVFDSGNDKIRALVGSGDALWVGSAEKGVARVEGGATAEVFTAADSGLPSDEVRALAVDAGGDVWVATKDGLARWKADRGVWVPLGRAAGIDDVDLRAVAASSQGAAGSVFAGGKGGLYWMGVP